MQVCELPPEAFVPGIDLTWRETATLAAIASFVAVQGGTPMPLWALQTAADEQRAASARGCPVAEHHRLDPSSPGRLYKLGLIELLGSRESRSYIPTPLGVARLQQ